MSPAAVTPFVEKAEAAVAAAETAAMMGIVDHIAGAPQGVDPSIATKYQDAKAQGMGPALRALIDDVPPIELKKAVTDDAGVKTTQALARSYKSLVEHLHGAQTWSTETHWRELPDQYFVRKKMLDDVTALQKALAAAGPCEATAKFPTAQLEAIAGDLRADLEKLSSMRDATIAKAKAPGLRAADVPTLEAAAKELGRLCGDPKIETRLLEDAAKLKPDARKAFETSARGLALVLDTARSAPDYASTRMGWHYPQARSEYRARAFDPWNLYASDKRQQESVGSATAQLQIHALSKDPAGDLQKLFLDTFFAEIGVPKDVAATWKPKLDAVFDAVAKHEALLPLRALNETVVDMANAGARTAGLPPPQTRALAEKLVPKVRDFVRDVTKNVVEGTYREWRYENPLSKAQLQALSKEQLAKWKEGLSVESWAAAGAKLKTREEDSVELMWVTKIGGPSHGFDYGGNCLLPLLGNGRTKTILVDDPRWEHNAAARCYIRMLPGEDGKPTLYLEPNQRDFPHRRRFDVDGQSERLEWESAQQALVKHAIAKAKALGVTLSVPDWMGGTLDAMGVDASFQMRRFVLHPSAGIFEASDTLGIGHDWINDEKLTTPPLKRFVIEPKV